MKYRETFNFDGNKIGNEQYLKILHQATTGFLEDNKAEVIQMMVNSGYENPTESDLYLAIEPLIDKAILQSRASLVVELNL